MGRYGPLHMKIQGSLDGIRLALSTVRYCVRVTFLALATVADKIEEPITAITKRGVGLPASPRGTI
jgi:hypothetical protein